MRRQSMSTRNSGLCLTAKYKPTSGLSMLVLWGGGIIRRLGRFGRPAVSEPPLAPKLTSQVWPVAALVFGTAVAVPAFAQVAAPLVVPPTERVLPAPQPQFSAPRPEIPPA